MLVEALSTAAQMRQASYLLIYMCFLLCCIVSCFLATHCTNFCYSAYLLQNCSSTSSIASFIPSLMKIFRNFILLDAVMLCHYRCEFLDNSQLPFYAQTLSMILFARHSNHSINALFSIHLTPFQVSTFHGSESNMLYVCTSDCDDESNEISDDNICGFQDRVCQNVSTRASPDNSWLEVEDTTPVHNKKETITTQIISSSNQFEAELRQHIYDVLHYIDDLERQVVPFSANVFHFTFTNQCEQVISSQASISLLSKPCATCSARTYSHHECDGKSENSRSSSRRGSSGMQFGSGDNSRKNSSVFQQFYGTSVDMTPSLPMVHHPSPVSASPEHVSISSHTIVATSLRASSRKNVAMQTDSRLLPAGESLLESGRDALQVVVSVKDRWATL